MSKVRKEEIDPFASNKIIEDIDKQGLQAPAKLLPKMQDTPGVTNFDAAAFSEYIGPTTSGALFNEKERARAQSGWEQMGRSLLQAGAEVAGGTVSGVGSIGAFFTDLLTEGQRQEADFSNTLMQIGEDIMSGTREANPIYRENPGKAFDTDDLSGWVWENLPSVASSLSMLIPARGVAGGLGMLGKMTGISAKMGKTAKFLGNVSTMAIVSRNAENMRESLGVAEQTREQVKEQLGTMNETELFEYLSQNEIGKKFLETGKEVNLENYSKFAGAQAGMESYKVNASNIAFDFIQTAIAYKALSGLTRNKNFSNLWMGSTGKKVAQAEAQFLGKELSMMDRAKMSFSNAVKGTIGGASEGVEEIINTIGTNEGLRIGDIAAGTDKSSDKFGNRLEKYLGDKHTWEAGFWGFAGGKLFETGSRLLEKAINKDPGVDNTMRLNEIGSRTENITRIVKDLEAVENAFKNGDINEAQYNDVLRKIGDQAAFDMGINAASTGQIDNLLDSVNSPDFKDVLMKGMSAEQKATMTDEKYAQMVEQINKSVLEAEQVYSSINNKIGMREMEAPIKNYILSKGIQNHYDTIKREKENADLQQDYDTLLGDSKFSERANDVNFKNSIELTALNLLKREYNKVIESNKDMKPVYTKMLEERVKEIEKRMNTLSEISEIQQITKEHEELVANRFQYLGNTLQIRNNKGAADYLFDKKNENEVKEELENVSKTVRSKMKEAYKNMMDEAVATNDFSKLNEEELKRFGDSELLARYNKLIKRQEEIAKKEEELAVTAEEKKTESIDTIEDEEENEMILDEEDTRAITKDTLDVDFSADPNAFNPDEGLENNPNLNSTQAKRLKQVIEDAIEKGDLNKLQKYLAIAEEKGITPEMGFHKYVTKNIQMLTSPEEKVEVNNIEEVPENTEVVVQPQGQQLSLFEEPVEQTEEEREEQIVEVAMPSITAEEVSVQEEYVGPLPVIKEDSVEDDSNIVEEEIVEVEEVLITEDVVMQDQPTNISITGRITEPHNGEPEEFAEDNNTDLSSVLLFALNFHTLAPHVTRNDNKYELDKESFETLQAIQNIKVGDTLEIRIDKNNPRHEENAENAAIAVFVNNKPIFYLFTPEYLKKKINDAVSNSEKLRYSKMLSSTMYMRNKIWSNPDVVFETKLTRKTSGSIIPGKLTPAKDVIAGSYKLAYLDPQSPNKTRLKVVGESDEYFGSGESTQYNMDGAYSYGVEYLLLEGLAFDGSLQSRAVARMHRANVQEKDAVDLVSKIEKVVDLMNKGASLNSETIETIKAEIGEIISVNRFNQEKSEVNNEIYYKIPPPFFKIHSNRIEFLIENKTKIVTIWFKDKLTGDTKIVVEEWNGKSNTFKNDKEFQAAKGKVLDRFTLGSNKGREALLNGLKSLPYTIKHDPTYLTPDRVKNLISGGRILADFGVLTKDGKNVSNFWSTPEKALTEGIERSQSSRLVLEIDSKITPKEGSVVNKTKSVEKELFTTEINKKGFNLTYYSNTTEKDGITTISFTFNRSDKGPSQRNKAVKGVPVDIALGDKYVISEEDIPEGAKVNGVIEIRIDAKGKAAATVAFENQGETYIGEVPLKENTDKLKYKNIEVVDTENIVNADDQIADIERRRKESFEQITSPEDFKKLGLEQNKDELPYSTTLNAGDENLEETLFADSKEKLIDKINAKYDAELAALQNKTKSIIVETQTPEQPTTTSDLYGDTLDIDIDDNSLLLQVTNNLLTSDVTPIEREANWRRMFGDNVEFDANIDELIRVKGELAFGIFSTAGAKIVKGAPIGTEYHEAFHAVTQLYLSKEELNKMYTDAAEVYGQQFTRLQLEEKLAEDFRFYAVKQDSLKNNKLKYWFNQLLQAIKKVLGLNKSRDVLFNNIYSGNFNYKPDQMTMEFIKKNPLLMEVPELDAKFTQQEIKQYVEWGTMMVANDLPIVTGKSNREIMENPNVYNLKLRVKANLRVLSERAAKKGDEVTKANIDKIAENWGDVNSGFWSLIVQNVKKKLNYNISFNEDEVNSFEGNVRMQKNWDDKVQYTISGKESFDFDLKRIIMLTPKLDNTDADVLPDGTLVFKNVSKPNAAKLPQPIDFNLIYPMFVKNMQDANTIEEMMERLKNLAEVDPSVYYLWNRVNADPNLRAKWYANFKKNTVEEIHTRYDSLENEGFDVVIDSANVDFALADKWVSEVQTLNSIRGINNETFNGYDSNQIALIRNKATAYLKAGDLEKFVEQVVEYGQIINMGLSKEILIKMANNTQLLEHFETTPINLIRDKVFNNLDWINNKIEEALIDKNPFFFSERGRLKEIADLYSYYTPDVVESSYINTQGKMIYNSMKPSFLSEFFAKIQEVFNPFTVNKKRAKEAFLDSIKERLQDKSMRFSNWMVSGLSNNGVLKKGANLDALTIDDINPDLIDFKLYRAGDIKSSGEGAGYTDLSDNDWLMNNLIQYVGTVSKEKIWGQFPIIIPSDSGNIWSMKARRFKLILKDGKIPTDSAIYLALKNVVKQEMMRMEVASNLLFEREKDGSNKYGLVPKKLTKEQKENLIIGYHYQKVATEPISFNGKIYFEVGDPITLVEKNGEMVPVGNVFKFSNLDFKRGGQVVSLNNVAELKLRGAFSKDLLNSNANALIEEHIQEFAQNTINNEVARYSEFKESILQSKVKKSNFLEFYNNNYELAVGEYALNRFLFNIEQANWFNGVLPEYKNGKDTAKRAKQVSTTKQPTSTFYRGETYQAVTFKDIILPASDLVSIEKNLRRFVKNDDMVKKVLDKYRKINIADAQGYITLDRLEATIRDYGRWNETYERVFRIARNPNLELSDSDLDILLEVQKPFYYGKKFNPHNGVFQSVQVKTALLPLIPKLIKGTELEKVANYMERNNISEAYFESAVKVGRMMLSDITVNGRLKEDWEKYMTPHTYYNSNWGVQLDVPSHLKDEVNKLGVQIAKLPLANLSNEAIYEVNDKKYTGEEIRKMLHELMSDNIIESSQELLNELNVDTNPNKFGLKSKESVGEILKREVVSRGLNKNFVKAISMVGKDFYLPLSATSMRSKFMSILSSLFTNRVTNQKFPGGHVVVASPAMMNYTVEGGSTVVDANGIDFVDKVKDRIKDGKFQLKYLDIENERITKVEALLPAWSKEFFKQGERVNINDIPEELRTMIGYRIPTEGKYSSFVFEIVGFLPESAGSTVIVPYELIAQTGWDFDVDSLYMMQRSFKTTVNGKEAADYVSEKTGIELKTVSKYINEIRKPTNLVEVPRAVRESYQEFVDNSTEYVPISSKSKSTEGRNNAIFDIYEAILSNPNSFKELVSGGNFDGAVALKNRVEELLGLNEDVVNVYTGLAQDNFRKMFMSGRALKGMAADVNSALAVLQNAGARFNDISFRFKYKTKEDNIQKDLFGDNVIPKRKSVKTLQMNFVFGKNGAMNKNDDVTANDTFEAIKRWERTATSRKDGSLDSINIGDIVTFTNGKESLQVKVTNKRKVGSTNSTYWSEIEGYKLEEVKNNWNSGKNLSEYTQIEFELLPDSIEVENKDSKNIISHSIIGNNEEGTYTNVEGDVILEQAAQILAMSLDIVKEGFPYNLNTYTFNTFMAMVSTGVPLMHAGMYIRQPILNRLTSRVLNNESVIDDIREREVILTRKEYMAALYTEKVKSGEISLEDVKSDGVFDKNTGRLRKFNDLKVKITKKAIDRLAVTPNSMAAYSLEELEEMVKFDNPEYRAQASSEEKIKYYTTQLQILDQWVNKYYQMGQEFGNVIANLKADKLGAGPNLDITPKALAKLNVKGVTELYYATNNPVIITGNGEYVLDDIYQGEAYPVFKTYMEHSNIAAFRTLSPLFLETQVEYLMLKDRIKGILKIKDSDENNTRLDKFLFKALYNKFGSIKINKTEATRLLGVNRKAMNYKNITIEQFNELSTAEKLSYVKANFAVKNGEVQDGFKNSFDILNRLTPKIEDILVDKRKIQSIQFDKPKSSDNIDDFLIESFENLLNSNDPYIKSLAEDLIMYDFYINGLTYSANSWREYVPIEKQLELGIGRDIQNIMNNINFTLAEEFAELFIKNNWNNYNIVPVVKTKYVHDETGNRITQIDEQTYEEYEVSDSNFFNWSNKANKLVPFAVPKKQLRLETREVKNAKYLLIKNKTDSILFKKLMFDSDADKLSDKELDVVYYYPVNKLGSLYIGNETTESSIIAENNIELTELDYIAMIANTSAHPLVKGLYESKKSKEREC